MQTAVTRITEFCCFTVVQKQKYDDTPVLLEIAKQSEVREAIFLNFEVNDLVGHFASLGESLFLAAKEFAARLVRGNFNAISTSCKTAKHFSRGSNATPHFNVKP
jgi:hypothetical protein